MANLPETTGATYPTVRQIENGEAQAGGLNGLWNEHAKAMIERTNSLKSRLDGSGVALDGLASITDFNAVTKAGTYRSATGIPNAPLSNTSFTLLHMPAADTSAATQLAFGSASDRVFWRRRTGGTWGAWREIWSGAQPTVQLGSSGYQVLPSGLLLQWGLVSSTHGGSVTFPVAFPSACYGVTLGDEAINTTAAVAHVLSVSNRSTTGFTISMVRHDADTSTGTAFFYMALGI